MLAYWLLILGLFFVWLEFYLPSGALAAAGAFFVLAALWTFFSESQSLLASVLFFIGTCVAVIVVIRLAIWRIRKSASQNTFFLSKDQEGYKATDTADSVIGKRGVTLTECGPSGFALIESKRYPVVCRGPYLNKGVEVEVIAKELGNYIVKPVR